VVPTRVLVDRLAAEYQAARAHLQLRG